MQGVLGVSARSRTLCGTTRRRAVRGSLRSVPTARRLTAARYHPSRFAEAIPKERENNKLPI